MTCPPVLVNLWVANCYIWQSVYKYYHRIYTLDVQLSCAHLSCAIFSEIRTQLNCTLSVYCQGIYFCNYWNRKKGITISPSGCWCTWIKSFASIGKLRTIYSWFRLVSKFIRQSYVRSPYIPRYKCSTLCSIQTLWNNQKTHLDHWVTQAGRFLNNRKRENTLIWSLNSCSKGDQSTKSNF